MNKNRIRNMTFTPHDPPQPRAEADFQFDNRGGTQIMRISLDKNRVWHQYTFGDKDLLRLQRRLNAHIKKAMLSCPRKKSASSA